MNTGGKHLAGYSLGAAVADQLANECKQVKTPSPSCTGSRMAMGAGVDATRLGDHCYYYIARLCIVLITTT